MLGTVFFVAAVTSDSSKIRNEIHFNDTYTRLPSTNCELSNYSALSIMNGQGTCFVNVLFDSARFSLVWFGLVRFVSHKFQVQSVSVESKVYAWLFSTFLVLISKISETDKNAVS